MTYLFRGVLFRLLYFVPIMALKHINPYYSLLNHLFCFRLLYALHVSISIKPIIYIISLISYYFNQTEISVIIAIIYIIEGFPCCNVLSHPFGPIGVHYISRDKPKSHELTNHILHPSDSVPWTLLAVAGRSFKTIAQAVWNGSCVTDRNYWQFPQDTLNGDDVENWFLVV